MKVAFLDRDGTIIIDKNYLDTPDGIEFLPNAIAGLKVLTARGYELFLITNQSGIGRGYFTEATLTAIHQRLKDLLKPHGITLTAIYYCPHAPKDECNCRKPKTGMLEQACRDYDIDLKHAVVIGDSKGDIGMGKAFGIPTIQVTNGENDPLTDADYCCKDLLEAAQLPIFD